MITRLFRFNASMINWVPAFIGLRYIRSKRRDRFVSFVSLFALAGMALGVFALILVLSVMNGFDHELKKRILNVIPHGFLYTRQPMNNWQELADAVAAESSSIGSAPYIGGRGLLAFDANIQAVELQGILPELEKGVSSIHQHMLVGDFKALETQPFGIVVGSLLARYLGVTIGDKVSLTLPEVAVTPAGVFPRTKRFTVVGVFQAGAQVDQSLVLIHLRAAQKLFRRGQAVDGLRLKFDDIYRAPEAVKALQAQLGERFIAKDWSQTQGSLFQAVKMEKTVIGIMLSVVIAVAALNIVTALLLMVADKRADIAVLRTMGLPRGDIMAVFIVQGFLTGVIGIVVGALSGVIAAHYVADFVAWLESISGVQVFDPSVYFITHIPSVWRLDDTLWICLFAVLTALISTLYPAYRAAKIAPAEALSYEV